MRADRSFLLDTSSLRSSGPTPPPPPPLRNRSWWHSRYRPQPSTGDTVPAVACACMDWGAFQVVNHGVSSLLREEMKYVGSSFFSSPMEAKLRFVCDLRSPASEEYGSRMLSNDDGVLDWRDYFDHHTLPVSRRNPSRWPDFPTNYRDTILEYSDGMKKLAQTLLHMISQSVGLPPSYIKDAVGEVYQNISVSYYPPCPQPELALGLQSHSDMGAITLLIQDDVQGLEVLKDDEWVAVHPLSGAIVVILSDQMEDLELVAALIAWRYIHTILVVLA